MHWVRSVLVRGLARTRQKMGVINACGRRQRTTIYLGLFELELFRIVVLAPR